MNTYLKKSQIIPTAIKNLLLSNLKYEKKEANNELQIHFLLKRSACFHNINRSFWNKRRPLNESEQTCFSKLIYAYGN